MTNKHLLKAKRLVLKIGSSLLVDESTGRVKNTWLNALADDILTARERGQQIVIVTSGAGAIGRRVLGLPPGKIKLPQKQAAAAVGQCELMYIYDKLFAEYNHNVAQILLTGTDVQDEKRHLNFHNTINRLIELRVLPIINENDTIATEEISVGDNDTLGAIVAASTDADLLVLLSDIDGLYTADPHKDTCAKLIHRVPFLTDEIKKLGGDKGSALGTGGMKTKLGAAEICTENGCDMVIANGSKPELMYDILDGKEVGTYFVAEKKRK